MSDKPDPTGLTGCKLEVAGYGVGTVLSFRKVSWPSTVGSPHTIQFEDGR